MAYRRSYTSWHSRAEGRLVWIDGDEGTGKCLVKWHGQTYGTHKWNRLPMEEAPEEARRLAVCEPGNRCQRCQWRYPYLVARDATRREDVLA